MKKISSLFFILISILLLTSCNTKNTPTSQLNISSTVIKDNSSVQNEIEILNSHFVRVGGVGMMISDIEFENSDKLINSSKKHANILKITSLDKLQNFSNTLSNIEYFSFNYNNDNSLEKSFAKYDEKFFNENLLLLVSLQATSGSTKYEYIGYNIVDNCLQLEIKPIIAPIETSDMADWIGIIEVKKDSFNNSLTLDAIY